MGINISTSKLEQTLGEEHPEEPYFGLENV
jgi:hypothetical protein